MQFFTNKISVGNKSSFGDLIRKVAGSEAGTVKTASLEEVVVAEAGIDDDGEGKRTDVHHGEGSPKDQNGEPEKDGENKTVDPAGLSAGSDQETKVAETGEGDSGPSKPDGAGDGDDEEGCTEGRFPEPDRESSDCYKQEAEDKETADVEASTEKQVKEAGELPEALKEHQFKSKDSDDKDDDKDKDSEAKADDKDDDKADDKDDDDKEVEACTASSNDVRFEKIANLSPKAKGWLKTYWKMVYPEAYSDAMVQDK